MSDHPVPEINDQWIRQQRGNKNQTDPYKPYAWFAEQERTLSGSLEKVNTIFLVNRECRYTCLMCDLWKNTTDMTVPEGAIPAQIEWALKRLPPARHIKLYNSSSFFDPGAIPIVDFPRIAELVYPFENVIVENHPLLTGERCLQFSEMIRPQLQVALGLETVHKEVLSKLNKKMSPEDFCNSVRFLKEHQIETRAFILLRPPFLSEEEGIHWACKSLDFAFECGTDCCTIIPVRAGNGAMDRLQDLGRFSPPLLNSLEHIIEYGISLGKGPVFADSWDLQQFSVCTLCYKDRKQRIERMNLAQAILPSVVCTCETSS